MGLLDDPLAVALGTANANSQPCTAIAVANTTPANVGIDNDQDFARDQLIDVIENSAEAIQDLMKISKASQHPRAFEVLEKLLMRQQDAAKQLLELHKTRAQVGVLDKTSGKAAGTQNVVNQTYIANAVFTGTTAELLDKLQGKNREIIEHDDMLLEDDT